MKISVDELKNISDVLFGYLEENGIKEFELTENFYRFIPTDSIYNMSEIPEELTIGELIFEYQLLQKSIKDGSTVGRCFVWYSAIMRYLGDKIP